MGFSLKYRSPFGQYFTSGTLSTCVIYCDDFLMVYCYHVYGFSLKPSYHTFAKYFQKIQLKKYQ